MPAHEVTQPAVRDASSANRGRVDLYWLPLGAGGHSVRLNGLVFEAMSAAIERRPRLDLYHSALEVHVDAGRFVVEMTPVPRGGGARGVVAEGPVGARRAARLNIFRYELHRWRDGSIPDVAEAVDSPRTLSRDVRRAQRVLELVSQVPTPVWGRDELHAGEMWNSNSVVAWLLERAGLDAARIRPPTAGRAPGWRAGVVVARRSQPAKRSWQPPHSDLVRAAAGDGRARTCIRT
jgi:hypothetical protein